MKRMFFFIIWCFAYCVFQITASSSVLYQEDGRLALSDSLSAEGMVYYQQGEYQKALQMCEEALRIQEETVGKKHPKYVVSLSNLALYHSSLGNYGEAIRLTLDVLAIQTEIVGTKHPEYAVSLGNLAHYYFQMRNYVEAIQLGLDALHILEKIQGKESPNYATQLSNLALYNALLGNYAESVQLSESVLNITVKAVGKEHSNYAQSLGNLALYHYHLKNYAKAIQFGIESVQIKERIVGKEHPDNRILPFLIFLRIDGHHHRQEPERRVRQVLHQQRREAAGCRQAAPLQGALPSDIRLQQCGRQDGGSACQGHLRGYEADADNLREPFIPRAAGKH